MNPQKNRKGSRWLAAVMVLLLLALLGGQTLATGGPAQRYPLGDIPLDPETYQRYLKRYPEAMLAALPLTYDARAEGIVTPAKDQGNCGSCWAFASVGAVESHLLKQYGAGPEDFSEQQQVSCNNSMWGCSGGNATALRYWESKGPLYEDCFPYSANDGTPCAEDQCEQLPYRVVNYHTVASDQFNASLYYDGPSYWRYTVYTDFFNFWNYGSPGQVYVNNSTSYEGGHAVLLIGWDDSKGAYLCKNSWGEHDGPNGDGTFWIAYSGHLMDLGFGMSNFGLTSPIACYGDQDCDDGQPCTADTCFNAGTPQAYCEHAWPACGPSDGCCGPECSYLNDPDCPACGDGYCAGAANGEDCDTCPLDCPSGSGGGTCAACFKGVCDGVCHPVKEGPDCADCNPGWCCGNLACEAGENGAVCPVDCPDLCGDGTCDPEIGEDACTCADDCGSPPTTEFGLCADGLDNDCDGTIDCADDDCAADPACDCGEKGDPCDADADCCANKCRGGKCR